MAEKQKRNLLQQKDFSLPVPSFNRSGAPNKTMACWIIPAGHFSLASTGLARLSAAHSLIALGHGIAYGTLWRNLSGASGKLAARLYSWK